LHLHNLCEHHATEAAIDRSAYGLHRAAVREFAGLVFVWLDGAGEPAPFEEAARELGVALAPQGLCRARVADQIDYDVAANWKLVWQNNRECWHCHAGHPEYVRANFDAAPDTPPDFAPSRSSALTTTPMCSGDRPRRTSMRVPVCMASRARGDGGRPTEPRSSPGS
jgi:phenylpropionate dioxygenase-like ring-hydroxylating dioxygenase large terminal subunit